MKIVSKLQEEVVFLKSQIDRFNNIFKNSSHSSTRERLRSSSMSSHSRSPSFLSQKRTSPPRASFSESDEESNVILSQEDVSNMENNTRGYVPDSWEDMENSKEEEYVNNRLEGLVAQLTLAQYGQR